MQWMQDVGVIYERALSTKNDHSTAINGKKSYGYTIQIIVFEKDSLHNATESYKSKN